MAVLLTALCLVVYRDVGKYPFINLDDQDYVSQNAYVLDGLTWKGALWSFTTFHAANWHPLTWLSHMADVEMFGLDAGRHHLVNVMFHCLNTILLFFALSRMTGGGWQSGFVAALFAIHPLHVESVAWVSERKDVLSTCFWMLAVGAYGAYVRSPGIMRYLAVATCFALGLLCKPMPVTLPFVLLLLDYWPLRRFATGIRHADARSSPAPIPKRARPILEKIPLVFMSVISCVITYVAQGKGYIVEAGILNLGPRISNAFVSYARYLGKFFWPSHLAVFYPHPGPSLPSWQVMGSAALLVAVSALALVHARRRPYLVTGWFFFLGTLFPVCGLVQVGEQAMADRYTYVPTIGLSILIAWGTSEAVGDRRTRQAILGALGIVMVASLTAAASVQAGHWRSSRALFEHALAVTENNHVAYNCLGHALLDEGRTDDAIPMFQSALRINPGYFFSLSGLGLAYSRKGDFPQAEIHYLKALSVRPDNSDVWNCLGVLYDDNGRHSGAIEAYKEAIRLTLQHADAWNNMGIAYSNLKQYPNAINAFRMAILIRPNDGRAWYNLGITYLAQGKREEGRQVYEQLKAIDPAGAAEFFNLWISPGQDAKTRRKFP